MKEQDFMNKAKIIRETFNDSRTIKCAYEKLPDEHLNSEGDMFITENGEIIYLEIQKTDFDEDELIRYVELAENLYEKNKKHISIYILCPHDINVLVKEFDIYSESDFTIKLAKNPEDPYQRILDDIKFKMKSGQCIDEDDRNFLKMLPVMCDKKDRNHYRRECFRIINRIRF